MTTNPTDTQLQGETLGRLPCPFCGDTLIEIAGNEWEEDLRARCIGCLAASGRYRTKAEALTAWNTRTAAPSLAPAERDYKQIAVEIGRYVVLGGLSDIATQDLADELARQLGATTAPAESTRVEGEQVAQNRDKAQEIVLATEAALGEKFDSIARHELVNRITVALNAAAPTDNDAESDQTAFVYDAINHVIECSRCHERFQSDTAGNFTINHNHEGDR